MNVYTVPPGAIGLQGTAATWARLDSGDEPLPPTWTLVDGDMEIRVYRCGHADLDDFTAASLGIVVLRPGARVPVKDGLARRDEHDLTVDRRRRRGRSARRQRPRPR
jgi:hypothetical protein